MFIKYYLDKHYKIIENPSIDFLGVIIGSSIVIFLYIFFTKKNNNNQCDKNTSTKQENHP